MRDLQSGQGHIAAAHLKETPARVYRGFVLRGRRSEFPGGYPGAPAQGVRLYTAEFWYREGTDWRRELRRARAFLQERFTEAEA